MYCSRRMLIAFCAALTALMFTATAGASVDVRLKLTPRDASTRTLIRVELYTYSATLRRAVVVPRTFEWNVVAVGPRGATRSVWMHRYRCDPSRWVGSVRLSAVGRWQVRVLNYPRQTPGATAYIKVRRHS